MKILITGGLGYLGGRLAQFLDSQLLESGDSYQLSLASRHQVVWLPELQHTEVIPITWSSQQDLEDACRGMDAVIHLAAMNAQECMADPVSAFEFNAIATGRLLKAAVCQGVNRFIYVSTAHVYGNPLTGVITEDSCSAAVHPYATSHRAAEDLVRTFGQSGRIESIVVRLTNAYGPPFTVHANCWMLITNDLCRQAVTEKRMQLKTSGMQRRDFIPMADVCRALEHLLHVSKNSMGKGIFNVGGQWAPTIWEMSTLIQQRCHEILGFSPELLRTLPGDDDLSPDLQIRTDLLSQSGFQCNDQNRIIEIDNLIGFCSKAFS